MSEEADHLMQLNATVDDCRHGFQGAHVGVHLLVHQPEGETFIPNQSLERWVMFFYYPQRDKADCVATIKSKITYLVMTFCIGYAFLSVAPVGQCVDNIAYVPVLIL